MWIEICGGHADGDSILSRPARALWIEILAGMTQQQVADVEAREGLVD